MLRAAENLPVRPFQVRRFPRWIRLALALTETSVPAAFYAERDDVGVHAPIAAANDAYQGGMGTADITTTQGTVTPGFPIDITTGMPAFSISGPGPNFATAYVIFSLSVLASVTLASRTAQLILTPRDAFSASLGILFGQAVVPSASSSPWKSFVRRIGKPIYVPPGWCPVLYGPDLGAGETFQVFSSIAVIAPGFKPY